MDAKGSDGFESGTSHGSGIGVYSGSCPALLSWLLAIQACPVNILFCHLSAIHFQAAIASAPARPLQRAIHSAAGLAWTWGLLGDLPRSKKFVVTLSQPQPANATLSESLDHPKATMSSKLEKNGKNGGGLELSPVTSAWHFPAKV